MRIEYLLHSLYSSSFSLLEKVSHEQNLHQNGEHVFSSFITHDNSSLKMTSTAFDKLLGPDELPPACPFESRIESHMQVANLSMHIALKNETIFKTSQSSSQFSLKYGVVPGNPNKTVRT